MKIPNGLFTLTKEQKELSEMIYEGKVIKCLIAPAHTYEELEKVLPYTKTTFLFPEREMTIQQAQNLISMLVAKPIAEEVLIVTASMEIILNMIDACCRVLTGDGDIVPCPVKTFMANPHDIRYGILSNERYATSKEKNHAKDLINGMITKINKAKSFTKAEADVLKAKVDLIGEKLISHKLKEMIDDKTVSLSEVERLEARLEELKKHKKDLEDAEAAEKKRKKGK